MPVIRLWKQKRRAGLGVNVSVAERKPILTKSRPRIYFPRFASVLYSELSPRAPTGVETMLNLRKAIHD